MKYKTIFPVYRKNSCVFTMWAPKAKTVHLELTQSGQNIEMQQEKQGYWSAQVENAEPGTRYKYRLNNDKSYPDPASLSQPEGVHEASEVINLKDFKWTDETGKIFP